MHIDESVILALAPERLSDVSVAVRERHVGADIVGEAFVAWFHWPKGE